MQDVSSEIGRLESEIERLSDSLERCRKVALAARIAIALGGVLLAALVVGAVPRDVLWLMIAVILLLGGIVLSGSNRRTADDLSERIAKAEQLRATMIGEIELTLVPDAPRLLH